MSTKNESCTPSLRLALRRETVRVLSVRSGIQTGGLAGCGLSCGTSGGGGPISGCASSRISGGSSGNPNG